MYTVIAPLGIGKTIHEIKDIHGICIAYLHHTRSYVCSDITHSTGSVGLPLNFVIYALFESTAVGSCLRSTILKQLQETYYVGTGPHNIMGNLRASSHIWSKHCLYDRINVQSWITVPIESDVNRMIFTILMPNTMNLMVIFLEWPLHLQCDFTSQCLLISRIYSSGGRQYYCKLDQRSAR